MKSNSIYWPTVVITFLLFIANDFGGYTLGSLRRFLGVLIVIGCVASFVMSIIKFNVAKSTWEHIWTAVLSCIMLFGALAFFVSLFIPSSNAFAM
jgi:hypothetical protein